MLAADGNDMFTPEALAAILMPVPPVRTRSLAAGTGKTPAPGSTGSGVVPDLQIQFATNSAAISERAERRLNALATAMQFPQLQDVYLIIAGHTDARGSDESNKALSQRRANAVVDWLVTERSISPDRLQAIGYGEERLADRNNPASGVNRRVEVIAKQVGPSASATSY
jgi:outer membrane protein OmpA-like peptidoglycan-associated protein